MNRRGFFGVLAGLSGLAVSGLQVKAAPSGPIKHMALFVDGDRVLFERDLTLAQIKRWIVLDAPVQVGDSLETWTFERDPLPAVCYEQPRRCLRYRRVA